MGVSADPPHAIGVRRVRDLHDDGIDHGDVGADRDAVVEEPGVLKPSLSVIDVLLVQGPADDPANGTALHLPFHVGSDAPPSRRPE